MTTAAAVGLKEVLGDLTKKPGVIAALVVSRDGFVIEGLTSEEELDLDALGAHTSSALMGWESIGTDLSRGAPEMLLVEFESGPISVSPVSGDAVLVVLGNRLCNLGRLRIEASRVREAVAACL
ncbi:MAG TPA: roadblock/LC7 domain-containing protein [bacterium]|nr:roadblock/LC7 domain-containing protein [bacterium]